MGLRIQNNIAAMNAHKNLTASDASMSKALERLSSGYRINRAADDAAGLSISQGFRADIASFKVASRNTTEANALLQVAEGGMEQIGNMLTRLKELATQAASANVGSSERGKLNSEATQLTNEIDRIANSTKYGSTALLTGTFGASKTGTLGANTVGDGIVSDNIVYNFTLSAGADAYKVTALGSSVDETKTFYLAFANSDASRQTLVIQDASSSTNYTVKEYATLTAAGATSITFANLGITISNTAANAISASDLYAMSAGSVSFTAATNSTMTFKRTGLTSLNVNNAATGTYTLTDDGAGNITVANSAGTATQTLSWQAAGQTLNFDVLNVSFVLGSAYSAAEINNLQFTVTADTSAAGNVFQVGAKNDAYNQVSISITGVRISDLSMSDLDLSTASGAQTALDSIDAAISTLAGARGDIGSNMNRLSYAAANLQSSIENVQAAESVIRDVDMAAEMTTFTKNQILMQASIAMLAQANQSPQLMLSLFK